MVIEMENREEVEMFIVVNKRYNENDKDYIHASWLTLPMSNEKLKKEMDKLGNVDVEFVVTVAQNLPFVDDMTVQEYNEIAKIIESIVDENDAHHGTICELVDCMIVNYPDNYMKKIRSMSVIPKSDDDGAYTTLGKYFAKVDGVTDFLKGKDLDDCLDYSKYGEKASDGYCIYNDDKNVYLIYW